MGSPKVSELQLLQQNVQAVSTQKQQIEEQLMEFHSALRELETAEKAYRIVGKIMIAASKENLSRELNEKKEVAEIRLKNFSRQEEKLKQNMEQKQQEMMDGLNNG